MEAAEQLETTEPTTWKEVLAGEREKPYFTDILKFVEQERASGKIIYPKNAEIFAALQLCPFEDLKVVILGQDPYHGPGQAHGLCFSVQPGVALPPSLKNIFKELQQDVGASLPKDGSLSRWAQQGVLLLNAVLTVEASKPASHAALGWEKFTDRIIDEVNARKSGVVFLLWGAFAQKKGERIDRDKHLVLKAPHPSPFSADKGFFGCKHFSRTNDFLAQNGQRPIDW